MCLQTSRQGQVKGQPAKEVRKTTVQDAVNIKVDLPTGQTVVMFNYFYWQYEQGFNVSIEHFNRRYVNNLICCDLRKFELRPITLLKITFANITGFVCKHYTFYLCFFIGFVLAKFSHKVNKYMYSITLYYKTHNIS